MRQKFVSHGSLVSTFINTYLVFLVNYERYTHFISIKTFLKMILENTSCPLYIDEDGQRLSQNSGYISMDETKETNEIIDEQVKQND